TARCSATPRPRCCAWSAAISIAPPRRRLLPGADHHCQPQSETSRVRAMSVRLDHGDDSLAELHEINVTPFIAVMLVLLIIFMLAAPLATVDIGVSLPA